MNVFAFGLGYSAQALIRRLAPQGAAVAGTVRSAAKAAALAGEGVRAHVFPGGDDGAIAADLAGAEALLVSVPPGPEGDPVLAAFGDAIAAASGLRWIGYLSTIGVYGDRDGGWVDEGTEPAPVSLRSRQRLVAERGWLALGERSGRATQVFRLAGIYGPGRSAFERLADGTARRIVKPGQVFNRIHVADIAAVLEASLRRPRPGAVYNVTDDEPAPPADVIVYAAELAGVSPPPEEPLDLGALSPMAASFWRENKRVGNRLLREELGVALRYPTYREGLAALRPPVLSEPK